MTADLQKRAREVMPGGVNSPVRAFASVGGKPIFARRGRGPYLQTVDGRELIDFCMSFGPLILGHAHPDVVEAVREAATAGTSYAVTTEAEILLAETIRDAIPSMERVRLVSSGTEACMTAIRLARGVTGRDTVLKFSGCYHGHADCLLVQAGSGVAGIASASSAGVTQGCASQMLVAPYNDAEEVRRLVDAHGQELAAIILEPVAGNMGLVMPEDGFLEAVAQLARGCGALVIFDEVITGFRLTFGGYQNACGITPDLTTLGKTIGGGMPIGAIGGKADWMEQLAPGGDVYQAGTLSGNPVSVAAGLATLQWLKSNKPYAELVERTGRLVESIRAAASRAGVPLQVPTKGSLFSLFFSDGKIRDFEDAMGTAKERFSPLFHALLERNVYLPPSPFETCFLSVAHDDEIVERAADAFEQALNLVAAG
jgi:glutamate-1-semialdehyde 2,1-aminomutase